MPNPHSHFALSLACHTALHKRLISYPSATRLGALTQAELPARFRSDARSAIRTEVAKPRDEPSRATAVLDVV